MDRRLKKSGFLALFFSLLLVTETQAYSWAREYYYAAWMPEQQLILKFSLHGPSLKNGSVYFPNVPSSDARISPCPTPEEEAEFVCIFSDHFSFAFPRKRTPEQLFWSVGGHNFTVLEQGVDVSVLGHGIRNCLVINTPPSATKLGREKGISFSSLYHPDIGILAIKMEDPKDSTAISETYWLWGKTGLAALPDGDEEQAK